MCKLTPRFGLASKMQARPPEASRAAFPGPSDQLRTHNVQESSLRLTWTAPASGEPASVLGYQVLVQAGGTSGFAVVVQDTGSAAPEALVAGLQPGSWCAAAAAPPPYVLLFAAAPPVPFGRICRTPPHSLTRSGTSSAWPRGRRAGSAR